MVSLCPEGSEGASYSLFCTFINSALLLAPTISATLLGIWDVSKEALMDNELSGLINLTLLVSHHTTRSDFFSSRPDNDFSYPDL